MIVSGRLFVGVGVGVGECVGWRVSGFGLRCVGVWCGWGGCANREFGGFGVWVALEGFEYFSLIHLMHPLHTPVLGVP